MSSIEVCLLLSTDIFQCLQLLLDRDSEAGQVDGPRVLLELTGIDFAGDNKVFDDVLRRGNPGFKFVESGVIERVADGADGLDAVQRLSNDAGQKCRGCWGWKTWKKRDVKDVLEPFSIPGTNLVERQ
jgi:hypothetical protein